MAESTSPRSLTRLLGLFDVIATEPEGVTLARLSTLLGSPKSSMLTLLRPLVSQSYLSHKDGRYQLGPEIYRLAANILATRKFSNLMRGFMEDLSAESGETVILATLDASSSMVYYLDVIESPQSIRYAVPAGVARPMYCSAAGRLLLAYQDSAWRDAYFARTKLEPLTGRTVTDVEALRKILADIRRVGYATSMGEAVQGAAGVAAPVYNGDGSLAAALLIGAPEERARAQSDRLVRITVRVAAEASRALGFAGNGPGSPRGS